MKRLLLGLLLIATALELGCGGGGSAASSPPPQPVSPPEVALTGFLTTSFTGTKDVEFDNSTSLIPFNSIVTFPFQWTITSGSLPPGIQPLGGDTNPPSFRFKGTPTATGSYSITLEVRDSGSPSKLIARHSITFTIDSAFKFSGAPLPEAVMNVPYSSFVKAVNGVAPVQYSMVTGSLPQGLQLNAATGEISGIPTGFASPFTVQATDSSSPLRTIQQSFYVLVNQSLQFLDTTTRAYRGSSATVGLSVLGGVQPYKVTLLSGSLPAGMQISGTQITGTPTTDGDYTAVLQVADSYSPPNIKQATIEITVTEPPPSVVTRELPHAVVGQPYSYRLAAVNGLRPYTWQSSSLPAGLSLASDGLISGTPAPGAVTTFVSVIVQDSTAPPQSSSQGFTLVVRPAGTGRNDSIATATPMSNGFFQASLSPYANASGIAQPDQDFYRISANGGAQVTISVIKGFSGNAGMDPAVEILDSSGVRMTTCRNQGTTDGLTPGTVDQTPTAFDDPCVNDDIDPGVNTDAYLELQVPGSGPQTIYVRVFDLNGRARPDMKYSLNISGAN